MNQLSTWIIKMPWWDHRPVFEKLFPRKVLFFHFQYFNILSSRGRAIREVCCNFFPSLFWTLEQFPHGIFLIAWNLNSFLMWIILKNKREKWKEHRKPKVQTLRSTRSRQCGQNSAAWVSLQCPARVTCPVPWEWAKHSQITQLLKPANFLVIL